MLAAAAAGGGAVAAPAAAEEIGEVTTAIKILGANHRIVVEAFDDPKVEGVACFVSRARTGGIKGSLGIAEDTSDASIDCQQTGPVKFREELEEGEEVFSAPRQPDLQARPGGALLRRDAQRAGLPHLFRPGDRGLAEEQHLGRGDPRLAVSRILYRAAGPVTLVGGGPVDPAELAAALALAPEAVAADGGGDVRAAGGARVPGGDRRHGLARATPSGCARAGVPMHAIAEQDTTDLEKCLYSVEAPLFIGLGFLGGRIDHHLAAMNALVKYPGRRRWC